MIWRQDLRRAVGGAVNVVAARLMNRGRRAYRSSLSWEAYTAIATPAALDTACLLAGRSNAERARLTEAILRRAAVPVVRVPYRTISGPGVNLLANVGGGQPVLLLAGHHDAVPGSPGANDNAAAVGILVALWHRLARDPPRRLTVRFAFFGGEERGMLGSRIYARTASLDDLVGVVSLELCGIGDSLVLWDVTPALERSPLGRAWIAAAEALGARRDETYHLAERVPFFGSDHRPFTDRGVAGAGLTLVPTAAAEDLRRFIYGGLRGALAAPARRPPPFTTYHTADDRPETLDPAALLRAGAVLEGLVRILDERGRSG